MKIGSGFINVLVLLLPHAVLTSPLVRYTGLTSPLVMYTGLTSPLVRYTGLLTSPLVRYTGLTSPLVRYTGLLEIKADPGRLDNANNGHFIIPYRNPGNSCITKNISGFKGTVSLY